MSKFYTQKQQNQSPYIACKDVVTSISQLVKSWHGHSGKLPPPSTDHLKDHLWVYATDSVSIINQQALRTACSLLVAVQMGSGEPERGDQREFLFDRLTLFRLGILQVRGRLCLLPSIFRSYPTWHNDNPRQNLSRKF